MAVMDMMPVITMHEDNEIGLSNWEFGGGKFDKIIAGEAQKVVAKAFAEDPPRVSIPLVEFGPCAGLGLKGDAVVGPLTFHVALPLGAYAETSVFYAFDLKELVAAELPEYREYHANSAEFRSALMAFIEGIREVLSIAEQNYAAAEADGGND